MGTPKPSAPRAAWSTALFRALTWLLPGWMRREWGPDLVTTAARRVVDAESEGPVHTARVIALEAFSMLRAALLSRSYSPQFPDGRKAMFEQDNRPLRVAWLAALVIHFVAFTAVIPMGPNNLEATPEEEYTVVKIYHPPKPPPETPDRRPIKRKVNPVPIPDPTPNDPEPVVTEEYVYESTVPDVADVEYMVAGPSGPPPQDPGVYRVGADVKRPELIDQTLPEYPELARRARLECVVIMEARISREGDVVDLEVLRPCGLGLTEAALDAVRQWKYAPTTVDGRPVEVVLTATVTFKLTR